jgi:glycosyltransferase involved in cell wall biosynthesis
MKTARRVVFLTRILPHYRVPFHERVRKLLSERGIEYELVYGSGRPDEVAKGDLATLSWGRELPVSYFGPRRKLCWQHGIHALETPDLLILGQENSLLVNYPSIVSSWFTGRRVAFFGHGRGFQAKSQDTVSERFKRFWATKVHWWFVYTPSGCEAVVSAGVPSDRVTVFNNSVDTSSIIKTVSLLEPSALATLRKDLVGGTSNVGVYVGGIYAHKRIPFLLEAADAIRRLVPDFHLVIIGAGADVALVEKASTQRSWVHYMGPKFGEEKAALVTLAKVFLMPGLVGLAVLDSFAYGTPMVTTELTYHSPEIDYLQHGVNGVVVSDWNSPDAYAKAVARVLSDDEYRAALKEGGRCAASLYTIENMSQRFVEGVVKAVEVP